MKKDDFGFVSAQDLRIGLFVDLELGWTDHPFASGRFKISSDQQISALKGLPADRFRFIPSRSELFQGDALIIPERVEVSRAPIQHSLELARPTRHLPSKNAVRAEQLQALAVCERRFNETARQYSMAMELLHSNPAGAAQVILGQVKGLVAEIQQKGDTALRLLTDVAGDRMALHPVNVTVISLLLGRAMGLDGSALQELGLAAFLHDMGKVDLPERLRKPDDSFSTVERNAYQSHVDNSVLLARSMGLGSGVIQTIAQHHELADGSGFPQHLKLPALTMEARILALVNRYDGMCNPARPSAAMTPHEALALLFSLQKSRFDGTVLSAFIRMIGVYPPGSVVQLNDERHALVVSVNAARPLKPRVIVHEPGTPRHEALVIDLENVPNASIRRSLKPGSLSPAAQEYLQPRQRNCYFFDSAANAPTLAVGA